MKLLRCVLLLQFTTGLALSQPAQQSQPASVPRQPEALVRSLYQKVVARQTVGIPYSADMKIFAPYLSKTLRHRIQLARACGNDWFRQHPGRSLKPPFAWLEAGLFSGANERTDPNAFVIERAQSEKNGSFRVFVRLKGGKPPEEPWIWQVVAVLVRENGHLVVDDVLYLKDESQDVDSRLSEVLAKGCDGPRWVDHGDQRNDPKQQK
jgi:hypothetical protein